jgi:hypothetical protein
MKVIRTGRGTRWSIEEKTSFGDRVTSGFTIDDLDTKTIDQSENNYEEVFIRIRESLSDQPWCCDNREDVLSICQVVADTLRSNLLIRKEET